jgi:hypothetical protein
MAKDSDGARHFGGAPSFLTPIGFRPVGRRPQSRATTQQSLPAVFFSLPMADLIRMPRLSAIGRSLPSRITKVRPKFRKPAFDEAAFRRLRCQSERAFVCGDRVLCASQTAAEVGPCRVRQVVVREFAAREDRVDEREADFGAITHGDGGRAIEFHDGRRLDAQKYIIESNCAFGILPRLLSSS